MSNIRVTYSGLISFIIGSGSLFTGLIFTLIVTRQLTQEEFGTWSLIGGLVGYVLIISPIVSFWVTREIARGISSGKTAVITSILLSCLASLIYFVIVYAVSLRVEVDAEILFFSTILIPIELLRGTLVGIGYGYKPQNAEYGLLIFELTKMPLAFILVYTLELNLFGAIVTTAIANSISVIFLCIKNREKIKGKFQIDYVKKWLKLFWLPSYPYLTLVLTTSDVVIFTLITGSVTGVAFWSAARAISIMVGQSERLTRGLYPKLLGGGKKEYLHETLTRVFYFAIPIASVSIVFAKPGLFALNPIYESASLVVITLVPVMMLRTLGNVFQQALTGIEKVDVKENTTFREYLKSRLFYLPTLRIIQRSGYLSLLLLTLVIISPFEISEIDLVLYWALIALITQIPFTVYMYLLIKKDFPIRFDYKSISKYLLSSLFSFGLTGILMETYLEYNISIFKFLPDLILFFAFGVSFYLGITYLIDKKTKKLFKSVLNELR